jgi:hypothetical protein
MERYGLDSSGSGWGQVAGLVECRTEFQDPENVLDFLTSSWPVGFLRLYSMESIQNFQLTCTILLYSMELVN